MVSGSINYRVFVSLGMTKRTFFVLGTINAAIVCVVDYPFITMWSSTRLFAHVTNAITYIVITMVSGGINYRIFVSERMKVWYRKTIPAQFPSEVIYNGVPKTPAAWQYNRQQQALYISRIGKGNLPKMRQFIEFCRTHHLTFHIAGDGKDKKTVQKIKESLIRQYDFPESCFIGSIETMDFLALHAQEYLFAAGVGQVALECAAVGMPVLILSEYSLDDATFVTPENYNFFRNRNFTIRRQVDAARTLDIAGIATYPAVREQLMRDRDQNKIAQTYCRFIEQFM